MILHDQSQQTSLLGIKTLLGRPMTCTVLNSSLANKNGVIFGVPISDTEEDILETLNDRGFTSVKRLQVRNRPEIQLETVILTFTTLIPDRVMIASMCFRLLISVPNPYRCSKCGRLGHTTSRCDSNQQACRK